MKKFFALLFLILFILSPAYAGEKVRIGVATFICRTDRARPEMMPNLTKVFRDVLSSSSENIEVVDKSEKNNASTPCKYMLLGALMDFEITHTAISKKLTNIEAKVVFETRLVDVERGNVLSLVSGTGFSEMKQDPTMFYGKSKEKYQEAFTKNIRDQEKMWNESYAAASSMVSEKICAFLFGEYPEISSITPNSTTSKKSAKKNSKSKTEKIIQGTVRINRGTASGVYPKTFYRIYFEGNEISDMNGNSLGHEKLNIAIAEVSKAGTDSSTAEVIAGFFENIREGDKAEQISREEAKSIIDSSDFSRIRVYN